MKNKTNEKALKNSFRKVREDIEKLTLRINNLEDKKNSFLKEQNTGKIYTSKVLVNEEMRQAVNEVFDSGIFSNGEKCKEFEKKFAEFTQAKYAIAISNGTVAIEVALQCLGIKKGDEIIVPSYTTMPTIEPVLRLGAIPRFVDINENNFTLNPEKIKKAITKKTKAVIVVHIYGQSADIQRIKNICTKKKIFLIEDCAQAHNTKYYNHHVGTFGDVGCFSFYPTKNLTVCGEGGMIITNNPEINEKARMLINHGEKLGERYNHIILGNNYRLSEIHCAIGIEQLKLLNWFTERRREIAGRYNKLLNNKKIILPLEEKYGKHVYHLYVIRVKPEKRDKIIEELKKDGIYCGVHYPVPCHKQKIVKDILKKEVSLPVTEKIVKEIISLPIYPELSDEDVERIAEKVNSLV